MSIVCDGSQITSLKIAEAQYAQRHMQPHQMRRIAGHFVRYKRDINRAQAVEIKITKSNMSCVKRSDKIVGDHMR
jgi:hypothetical protein